MYILMALLCQADIKKAKKKIADHGPSITARQREVDVCQEEISEFSSYFRLLKAVHQSY
jgi:cell division protein FtsL